MQRKVSRLTLSAKELLRTAIRRKLVVSLLWGLLCVLSGCGRTSGGAGGGSGGSGKGGSTLSISLVSPSSIMSGIPLGSLSVYGQGFTSHSEVYVDGSPAVLTTAAPDGSIQAEIPISLDNTIGVHQITVHDANGSASNALPFTVYSPQPGPAVLQAIPSFLVGEFAPDPTLIVTADINGDGLTDVIMSGPQISSGGTFAIFFGQKDGTLSPVQYLPIAFTPYALAAGDVDGDGNIDLVCVADTAPGVMAATVLLGDGHGDFKQSSTQPLPYAAFSSPAYLADLDGDGMLDLVVSFQTPSGTFVAWLKNMGQGNFGQAVNLASSAASTPFEIADFNVDGKPDILYTTPSSPSSLHILFNKGAGTFSDQAVAGLNGIVGLATVIDFNLDGTPDLAIQQYLASSGTVQMYSFEGIGNGSFAQVATSNIGPGPVQLVSGDFDHDGFPDLAGPVGFEPSTILYLFGDGYGNFVPQPVVGPEGEYVATGDFNGDGLPDVVVPDRFNFIALALGRTDRNFPSPFSLAPATATSVSAGDIDGDGWPDILIGGDPIDGIPGTIFINQKDNTFQRSAYVDPSSFMLADLSGKGVVDLLGGKGVNLLIWPNNGSSGFSSAPIIVPQPMNTITIADMNGDGLADIVSACPDPPCVGEVFDNAGSYQFTSVSVAPFSTPYLVSDFNRDGRPDIVASGTTFLNLGGGQFQAVSNQLPMVMGALVAAGDFNGDGINDIAINVPGDTSISIWYGNGDGTFYQATQIDPGQYPSGMAAGNFSGGGHSDLAVTLLLSNVACIFSTAGQGQFTRYWIASGADTGTIIATDLNRDGKADLAITNFILSFEPANAVVIFHQ